MIVSKVPYRVSFLGGGSDYPSWYKEHGGRFLGASIDRYVYVSIRNLPRFFEHKTRVVWTKTELVNNNNDIEHPAVRSALQAFNVSDGLEIHYDGDLPARSGIGSSSAFLVAMLHALQYRATGKECVSFEDRMDLIALATDVERRFMGESGGIQDQIITGMGGINYLQINPDETYEFFPVGLNLTAPLRYNRHKLLEQHLGLFYLKPEVPRYSYVSSSTWDKELKHNTDAFMELSDIALEGYSILESNNDINQFGRLLDRAWEIKKKISVVSTERIDMFYRWIKSLGAIGGKLIGSGKGGFFLVFAEPEVLKIIGRSMVYVPVRFEYDGATVLEV